MTWRDVKSFSQYSCYPGWEFYQAVRENSTQTIVHSSVFIINRHLVQHVSALILVIVRCYSLRIRQGKIPVVCALVFFLKVFLSGSIWWWLLLRPKRSTKWWLIIKIELWTTVCVLFSLTVWIHNRMYKPKFTKQVIVVVTWQYSRLVFQK
jgi:hypothetical protein